MVRTADFLLTKARVATLSAGAVGSSIVEDGAIAVRGGRIVAIGRTDALAVTFAGTRSIDLGGRLVTPGLIDCHTHLIHGGSRAAEFEARLAGAGYAEIARAGGGILSTVRATRPMSVEALADHAMPRLDRLLAEGVTTIEIKSGYGLDLDSELRMLRAARLLGDRRPVSVVTSFLGAHAVGPEFAGDAEAYIDAICRDWLPAVAQAGLADAVDGFCESIAFTTEQIGRVMAVAAEFGLRVKLHADQLTDGGGAVLAASHRALSADHLEYTGEAGVRALAASHTVAVLLPGAFYYLGETVKPPVDLLRKHGVAMAVATDYNPGTSPITSILTAMNMASVLFGLTVGESLAGVTREAARALGLHDSTGTIEPGKYCDLAVWNVDAPSELVYRLGDNPLHARIWRGQCPLFD